jgi:hypothetical protein
MELATADRIAEEDMKGMKAASDFATKDPLVLRLQAQVVRMSQPNSLCQDLLAIKLTSESIRS